MLAIHQLNQKSNHSTREKGKMATRWEISIRGMDASCPSINRSRKAITQHGKREKWTWDGNLIEGAEMLAVHPSIKPENQSFVKENEMMDSMNTS
jgi:hypothetical protein